MNFFPAIAHWPTEALAALSCLPILLAVSAATPWLFGRLCKTTPLADGDLRAKLERLADRAGVGVCRIAVWNTGGASANAIAAGFTRASEAIFLTDGLLSYFEPEEIEALFLHELAHLKRRHVAWRVFSLAGPVSMLLTFFALWPAPEF